MSNPNKRLRESLTGFSQSQLIDVLLDTNRSPETRIDAAFRLGTRTGLTGKYVKQALLKPLLTTLGDGAPEVRSAAAHALHSAFFPLPPNVIERLTCLLDDDAPIVRSAAVVAIAGTDDSMRIILKALRDPSAKVRLTATFALGVIMPGSATSAIADLEEALTDPDSGVRSSAAESLMNIRSYHGEIPIQEARWQVRQKNDHPDFYGGSNDTLPF